MKAVIEIAPHGSVFKVARKQLKAAEANALFGAAFFGWKGNALQSMPKPIQLSCVSDDKP